MTNDELQRTLTRVADSRLARRTADDAAAASAAPAPASRGGPFVVGDRVFDVDSGQDGTVTEVGPAQPMGRTDLGVQLGDGTLVRRQAANVIARPRRPAARS